MSFHMCKVCSRACVIGGTISRGVQGICLVSDSAAECMWSLQPRYRIQFKLRRAQVSLSETLWLKGVLLEYHNGLSPQHGQTSWLPECLIAARSPSTL